jgi:hypothetical protein
MTPRFVVCIRIRGSPANKWFQPSHLRRRGSFEHPHSLKLSPGKKKTHDHRPRVSFGQGPHLGLHTTLPLCDCNSELFVWTKVIFVLKLNKHGRRRIMYLHLLKIWYRRRNKMHGIQTGRPITWDLIKQFRWSFLKKQVWLQLRTVRISREDINVIHNSFCNCHIFYN